MNYNNIKEATFLRRDNRFIATVLLEGRELRVHVKNTGRCKELLVEGCRVYLEMSEIESRKTPADLIAVEKMTERGSLLINMDSQIPNAAVAEWLSLGNLFSPGARIKREVTYGESRFDIYVEDGERRAFVEVKGVTLESDGTVRFPDAPTARGRKHLESLRKSLADGYEAYVFFLVQMSGVRHFEPNFDTDPDFSETLVSVANEGVHVLAYDSIVTPQSVSVGAPVEVCLTKEDFEERAKCKEKK